MNLVPEAQSACPQPLLSREVRRREEGEDTSVWAFTIRATWTIDRIMRTSSSWPPWSISSRLILLSSPVTFCLTDSRGMLYLKRPLLQGRLSTQDSARSFNDSMACLSFLVRLFHSDTIEEYWKCIQAMHKYVAWISHRFYSVHGPCDSRAMTDFDPTTWQWYHGPNTRCH